MAHPYHHALCSVRSWGGSIEDYLAVQPGSMAARRSLPTSGTGRCAIMPRASSCRNGCSAPRSPWPRGGGSRPGGSASSMSARIWATSRASPTGPGRSARSRGWDRPQGSSRLSILFLPSARQGGEHPDIRNLPAPACRGLCPGEHGGLRGGGSAHQPQARHDWRLREMRKAFYRNMLRCHAPWPAGFMTGSRRNTSTSPRTRPSTTSLPPTATFTAEGRRFG